MTLEVSVIKLTYLETLQTKTKLQNSIKGVRVRIRGSEMLVFREIWRALFS